MQIQVLPSLLAADVGNLESAARKAENAGGDALHIDIMDGHFVPNLSLGPAVVEMAKACVSMPLSVHLMMTNPDEYITRFAEAGADSLQIHLESGCDVLDTLERIGNLGMRVGITVNPETPAEIVFPVLDKVSEVLCMTVHPGYGGQSFMAEILPKIRAVREQAKIAGNHALTIMVDGGINIDTARECAVHGANAFVAGTYLFKARDMAAEIAALRRAANEAFVV